MNRRAFFAIVLLGLMLALVPASAQTTRPKPPSPPQNERRSIVEGLRSAGNFTKFLLVLDKAGFTQRLSETNQTFTLFAPDDKSFQTLPKGVLERLVEDTAGSKGFILPFIVSGRLSIKDLVLASERRSSIQSLAGTSLRVSMDKSGEKSQRNSFTITFDPPAPIRPAANERRDGNAWPCCGRIASAENLTANGIYYEVSFNGTGGIARQ